MTLKTKDVVWVEDHESELLDYVQNKHFDSLDHQEYFEELLKEWENAYQTRTILEDFLKSNQEKIDYFLNKFETESLIVSIIADRGQGKTAFCVWLLEEISKRTTKQIYALFPFPPLPFVKIVYDISQVPANSILYIDELAKKYKARDFSSEEAMSLVDELVGLRHNDISIIGSTQDLALIDINFIRLSDVVCWKYYNLEKSQLSRDGFITEVMKQLMPERNAINDILINDRGELSTLTFPFSIYSKNISKYLSTLKNSKDEIIEFLQKYHQPKEIIKLMHTQYGTKLSLEEQNFLLKSKTK